MVSLGFVADSTFLVSLAVAALVVLLYTKCRASPPPPAPVRKVEKREMRDYTKAELAVFNGTDSQPTFIAVLGKVFDVSGSPFYAPPDGPYRQFAGKDITFALARDDLDPKALTETRPLTAAEEMRAKEWQFNLEMKYPLVGRLLDGYQETPRAPSTAAAATAAAVDTGVASKKTD